MRGRLPAAEVLNVGLFDPDAATQLDAWMEELGKDHTPESETCGLGTHIYRAARPFEPERFTWALTAGLPPNVIRSKGWVNLGDGVATLWNHTGRQLALKQAGTWHRPEDAVSDLIRTEPTSEAPDLSPQEERAAFAQLAAQASTNPQVLKRMPQQVTRPG